MLYFKACALMCRTTAASWDEKSGDIRLNQSIDISVAVATDKVIRFGTDCALPQAPWCVFSIHGVLWP